MTTWTDEILIDGVNLRLVASENGILRILLRFSGPPEGRNGREHPLLAEAAGQLRAYFAGELREFRLPLDLRGTDFQLRVWRRLLAIPYGETRSYLGIAHAMGAPGRGARGGGGQRLQSDFDRGAVPPRDRRPRQTGGLRRRPGPQAAAARPGAPGAAISVTGYRAPWPDAAPACARFMISSASAWGASTLGMVSRLASPAVSSERSPTPQRRCSRRCSTRAS